MSLLRACGDVWAGRDWSASLTAADAGMVWERAKAHGISLPAPPVDSGLPSELRQSIRRARMANALALERACAQAREVGAALASAGVEAVALKGLALVGDLWQARDLGRDLGDLDLLVAWSDLDAAVATMSALGYRQLPTASSRAHYRLQARMGHLPPFTRPDSLLVEIHSTPRPIRPERWRWEPELLRDGPPGIRPLRRLSAEAAFAHGAAHFLEDLTLTEFAALKGLADLYLLATSRDPELNPAVLEELCGRWACRDAAAAAVATLSANWGCGLSIGAGDRAISEARLERLPGPPGSAIRRPEEYVGRFRSLRALSTGAERCDYLRGLVLPDPAYLRYHLGDERSPMGRLYLRYHRDAIRRLLQGLRQPANRGRS